MRPYSFYVYIQFWASIKSLVCYITADPLEEIQIFY